MAAYSFRDLDVWKLSMEMVESVYALTGKLPASENYVMVSQIRRSAISVPSNIAEGSGRDSTKEYIQFINISIGSLCELETQLLLIQRIYKMLDSECTELLKTISSIGRMLHALNRSLRNKAA